MKHKCVIPKSLVESIHRIRSTYLNRVYIIFKPVVVMLSIGKLCVLIKEYMIQSSSSNMKGKKYIPTRILKTTCQINIQLNHTNHVIQRSIRHIFTIKILIRMKKHPHNYNDNTNYNTINCKIQIQHT